MGRSRTGARLIVVAAAALAGCATTGVDDAPATSTIRELTIAPSSTSAAASGSDECAAMLWPVDGTLSSPFGAHDGRSHEHEGIDVAVAADTPVRAACDGQVTYAGNGLRGYGNVVIVQHADGLVTLYAHNRELEVRAGDVVRRGQVIARSGATGNASGPHLHFEVRLGSIARDPLGYLSRNEQSGDHR